MNQLTISVVIPTFNRPKYLERSIKSVLKQTYPVNEITVVVDGFSEETKNKIDDINRQNNNIIHLIQTNEKVGGSEARNIGIRNSSSDLIALLDDDDEWMADKLETQIKIISDQKLDPNNKFLCFTSVYRYKDYDKGTYKILPNTNYSASHNPKIADYLFVPKGLKNQGFIQTSTILLPRKLALKTLFTKGMPKHQDWDWVLKLDTEHDLRILQVEEPKVIYHSDVPLNNRTGHINRWKYSEQWLFEHKSLFSIIGYENFILNYVFYLGISADRNLTRLQRVQKIIKRMSHISIRTIIKPHFWKIFFYCFKNIITI